MKFISYSKIPIITSWHKVIKATRIQNSFNRINNLKKFSLQLFIVGIKLSIGVRIKFTEMLSDVYCVEQVGYKK